MNINKIVLALVALAILSFSCASDDRAPIVLLDEIEKGAYPRLIDQTEPLINLFDIEGSSYTYNIEFVDEQGGSLLAEYVVDLVFDDNDPSNGDNSTGPVEYLTITPDQCTVNENGFLQAPTITITGPEALAAAGVTADQVSAGDNFNFVGRVVLTDGRTFSEANSSATIVGPSFRGHFNFRMPASCPSDLTGSYAYETTDIWCDGSTQTGMVDIIAAGGGTYYFSDWSFGGYQNCYGTVYDNPSLTFTDVCLEVSFTGFTDSFGDTWTYDSSVDGESWNIAYENTYGETGNATITFPGGVPFTLAE